MNVLTTRSQTTGLVRDAALAAGITFVVSLYVFWPLRNFFFNPWAAGDMLSTYVAADNWGVIASTPTNHYGFPLGMNLNLVPGVDITENIFAKAINLLSGNPYFGINLLLFLSFPILAALSVIALRLVGSRGFIAVTLAVAFAFIPYHWGRGLGHMYLASLYSVVTGIILVLLVGTGRFAKACEQRNWRMVAAIAALVVITAWSGLYYAIFTLILLVAAVVWRFAQRDSLKQLTLGATPIIAISALVLVAFVPGLLAMRNSPAFAVLAERSAYESVLFAGIFVMALLPAPILPESIFSFYNIQVTISFSGAPPFENRVPTNFGTLVTTAAVILFVVGLLMRYRNRNWRTSTQELPLVAYLLAVSTLFFIPWGLNFLFAETVTAQLRAWNRLLPVILLLLLLAAAIVLKRVKKKQTIALISVAGLGATFINSVHPFKENYLVSAQQATIPADAARVYTSQINQIIPEYCGVLQLPYMAYPENGPLLNLDDYGHFWLPINDSGKAWSYGAIKNTEAGYWNAKLPEIPTEEQVEILTQAGFCGIHLDIKGYVSPAADRIKIQLAERYGQPIATGNPNSDRVDTWFFYQITSDVQRPRSINELSPEVQEFFLAPALTTMLPNNPEFTVAPRGSKDGLTWWWTIKPQAQFTLHQINPKYPISGIKFELRSSECENASIEVSLTDTSGSLISEVVTIDTNPTRPTEVTLTSEPVNEAILTLNSNGTGCTVENFPYPQFVQVINPAPLTN